MDISPRRTAIIGGGITGLSAAYYLKKQMEEDGIPYRITVYEKSETFGGKIKTLHRDGFVIEQGPDSFLARKPALVELARELGLEEHLTGTNPNAKKTYILSGGKLHRMPPGLMLGIPTRLGPFMRTGLLSPKAKARAALDLFLPKRQSTEDESLGEFLERRLGREVLSQIAEPLLAGIYAGDTYSLSVKGTFPQFHSIEQKHRSLILGMMKNRKEGGQESRTLPEVAQNTTFLTFKDGLETIIHGLIDALDNVRFVKGCGITSVTSTDGGYRLVREDGGTDEADGVIVTLPAYAMAGLLEESAPAAAAELKAIEHVSVANIVMAFDESDLKAKLDGSGFVIPRGEGRFITACTWTSVKWLHTAPSGKVLLRFYVGRSGDDRWLHMTEDEVIRAVRKDLKEIMGVTAESLFTEMTPLLRSMPQYPVGHLERVRRVREAVAAALPGVRVTGAAFYGVGLPDCVRQGKESALDLAKQLKTGAR
ncbi:MULTISPECIES: protoporphyrinogen oxidase [unclassified Paenibacillus]|uniref:protoporphyrinogen oxidase n=1 Tax=unclassified Paenibacillus TaxID=185978 RepID=UPI000930143E|nr:MULTISPECIES: protoporphyrinogen oxidase [unclassified Paenibacillus]